MNKYQKALDYIVSTSCPSGVCCNECNINNICNNLVKDKINTLQELINNTIPVKAEIRVDVRPEYGENGAYVGADIIVHYHCPKCGAWINSEYGVSNEEELVAICSGCGQVIRGVEDE